MYTRWMLRRYSNRTEKKEHLTNTIIFFSSSVHKRLSMATQAFREYEFSFIVYPYFVICVKCMAVTLVLQFCFVCCVTLRYKSNGLQLLGISSSSNSTKLNRIYTVPVKIYYNINLLVKASDVRLPHSIL